MKTSEQFFPWSLDFKWWDDLWATPSEISHGFEISDTIFKMWKDNWADFKILMNL